MQHQKFLVGGCHCGSLGLTLKTEHEQEAMRPRACDCAFCTKHGAAYLSDAKGHLLIDARKPSQAQVYRQGSYQAAFLLCRECGVLVAVLYREGETVYGAVNARCLQDRALFGPEQTVSPQKLDAEEKTARWKAVWTPFVELVGVGI